MALWTPSDYGAAVAAWYDANDAATITQTSGAVAQWNDKSGNSRHLAQSTSFRQPAYSTTTFPGSLPGLSFATDDTLLNSSISGIAGGTRINVFTAMTMGSASASNARIFSTANTGDDDLVFIPLLRNSGVQQVACFVGGFRQGTAIVYDQAHVISSIQNSASVQVRVDGTGATATSVTPSSTQVTRWAIGDKVGSGGGDSLTGKVAELLVVTGDLSLADEQLFEGYLAWKWGTQAALPVGHPYESAAPTTGGGATDTPIAGGTGALTLTGASPTVTATANKSFAPTAGTLTLTGSSPTVTAQNNISVTPNAGTLTLTNAAPSVSITSGQTYAPGTGALTLTGASPTVAATAHQSFAPNAGTLSLGSVAPSVTATNHQSFAPSGGTLTLSGGQPSVVVASASATLTPGAGSLLLEGAQVILLGIGRDVDVGGAPSRRKPPKRVITDTRTAFQKLYAKLKAAEKAVEKQEPGPEAPTPPAVKKAVTEARKAVAEVKEAAPALDWGSVLEDLDRVAKADALRGEQIAALKEAKAQAEQAQRELEEDEELALMLLLAA